MQHKKIEILAPAGDMEKLKTAVYFGADAVYFAGKKFGLRAFSTNFKETEMKEAVDYAHQHNVKCYITVNILAHNDDFIGLKEYLQYLANIGVDAVIVADIGIANMVKEVAPSLNLHISTQANITNVHSALAWVKMGANRLILARELSIQEIKKIKQALPPDIEIECFCHGAMCVSYSGRCLLSNYLTGRDSNRGACAQPCRWNYNISTTNNEETFPICEDEKGTYILNSKDQCLIEHLEELMEAGITSFKIEGRMKSAYYVATTVNAYKRRFDEILNNKPSVFDYKTELEKTSHRQFTTGFYFKEENKQCLNSSANVQSYEFMATVLESANNGYALIEQRNRFEVGDILEVLSPTENFNKEIKVNKMVDINKNNIDKAILVQQKLYLQTDVMLHKNDILRKKI